MRWTARLRDPDLQLLDDAEFSEATLVKTYNAPSTLALTGRLAAIRHLLRPGHGIVLNNSDGQQFSGRLVQATRRGDGRGTAMYVGDMVRLWDRICYPNTNLAWDSQISDRDIVTGTSEARIISLVNRNAGPAAWHSEITGSDPGESTTFTQWKTIVPDLRNRIIQAVVPDNKTGEMYMTQYTNLNLFIRRLDENGVQLGSMTLPKGGLGDVMFLSEATVQGKRVVYITFRYGPGVRLSDDHKGTWIRLPFTNGKTWTASAALAYRTSAPAGWISLDRRLWCQGEVMYGKYTFRLYGTPYVNSGSDELPAIPAFVEVILNNKVVRTIPAAHLGRDGANNPYDGRLVPQGLAITTIAGQPSLLVGITTGKATGGAVDADGNDGGTYAIRIYSVPIKPKPRAAEDRRVPELTMPTSLNRGPSGTTTARSDVLGPFVAALAEAADLALSIDYAYDGEPRLAFTITDTPDLSAVVRVSDSRPGSGPVDLGEEWLYTDALPTMTTGLARAGGLGSDRILRYATNSYVEDAWDVRVEGFLDNEGLTDLSEINDNIVKALADAGSESVISAPLGASDLQWGVPQPDGIPLGSKISAVLDGQPVVERVRQITFTVSNAPGDRTTRTEAVLGSPDAALKTPTQRQLSAMLRRLQRLDGYAR